MPKNYAKINARLLELAMRREQLDDLYEALAKSVRIQQIWPEAFEGNGMLTVTPVLVGNNYPDEYRIPSHLETYPEPYDRVRKITRTYLRRSDGIEKDISEEDFFWIHSATADNTNLLYGGMGR